jgi:hypothetical protein
LAGTWICWWIAARGSVGIGSHRLPSNGGAGGVVERSPKSSPCSSTRTPAEAIRRLPAAPVSVVAMPTSLVLYSVELSRAPSRAWRAAFLRPQPRLLTTAGTLELGRLTLEQATVLFRTTPRRLAYWLRRIDRWVAYANSIVEE